MSDVNLAVIKIRDQASHSINTLSSADGHLSPDVSMDTQDSSGSSTQSQDALVALEELSTIVRDLHPSKVISVLQSQLSQLRSVIATIGAKVNHSASTLETLSKMNDQAKTDYDYMKQMYLEASTKAAELGAENIHLSRENASAISIARDGVKQARLTFSKVQEGLQVRLSQAEATIARQAKKNSLLEKQAHVIPEFKKEAERLLQLLDEHDELDFEAIVDGVISSFQHLKWRWQYDFARLADLLSFSSDDFDDIEVFGSEVADKVEELMKEKWEELDALSELGIDMENVNDLETLVAQILTRFRAFQQTGNKQHSEVPQLPVTRNDLPEDIPPHEGKSESQPTPDVLDQYLNIAPNDSHTDQISDLHDNTTTAIAHHRKSPSPQTTSPALPFANYPKALASAESEPVRVSPEGASIGPETEIYPCPCRARDGHACLMVFEAYEVCSGFRDLLPRLLMYSLWRDRM